MLYHVILSEGDNSVNNERVERTPQRLTTCLFTRTYVSAGKSRLTNAFDELENCGVPCPPKIIIPPGCVDEEGVGAA
jgi:hypothetical protein